MTLFKNTFKSVYFSLYDNVVRLICEGKMFVN